MMLSGPDPTKPTTSVSVRLSDRQSSGNRSCRSGQTEIVGWAGRSSPTEIGMSDQQCDVDHEDSSDASTSSGDIVCEIVDNSSRDEEIDEQLH